MSERGGSLRGAALWAIACAACNAPSSAAPDATAGGGDAVLEPDASPDALDTRDDDGDGLADAFEDLLAARFAPELRLPPDDIDWTRPSTTDWYLARVALQFDHGACPDDATNVLDVGAVTSANLAAQTHYEKHELSLCAHGTSPNDVRESNKNYFEFYLSPEDDAVYAGVPPASSSEWRVYTHVRPSTYVAPDGRAAAYDLQVWYFFPYNDGFTEADHEGDWEHLTLAISTDLAVVSVYLASHDSGHRFDDPSVLAWVQATHVAVYVANGSHATYESAGAHQGGVPVVEDHCYEGGPIWDTWQGAINIGERDHVLHGQNWASYGGRWGKRGLVDAIQSGPPGPMFNGNWDPAAEY